MKGKSTSELSISGIVGRRKRQVGLEAVGGGITRADDPQSQPG